LLVEGIYQNTRCDPAGLCWPDPKGVNLKNDFVIVLDGGSCFFQLKYDPTMDKFYDAFINGEA